jgi:hypothetical protein
MFAKNEDVGPRSQLRFRWFFAQRDVSGDMERLETQKRGQEQIIDEIETYIREGGGEYEDWYVGLTDDPFEPINEALLLQKVQSERLSYIETSSPQIAQAVADYFINLCGTDGNLRTKEINRAFNSIYVYKKDTHLVF